MFAQLEVLSKIQLEVLVKARAEQQLGVEMLVEGQFELAKPGSAEVLFEDAMLLEGAVLLEPQTSLAWQLVAPL